MTHRVNWFNFNIANLLMVPIGVANILVFPEKPPSFTFFDWMSAANIPYSENVCIQQYVQINEPRIITCELGGGRMGPIWSTGVISSDTPRLNLTQCPNTQVGQDISPQILDCSAQLNNQSLIAAYNQNCLGEVSCSINLSQFLPLSSGICADAPARVYIQYYCELTEQQINHNLTTRAWATALSITACILFLLGLQKHVYRIRVVKAHHNQGLVNPAAFSVRLAITDTIWTELMQNYNGQEPQLIYAQKQLNFDDESIVCISWENLTGDSIDHISNGNFDQVKQLPRPIAAYVTFKTIELKRQALRNSMFEHASSPFTIEWGNVDVSIRSKVILFVLLLIVYSALCIFIQWNVKYYLVYFYFIYDFTDSCRYLVPQFNNNAANFEYWAGIDQNYIYNSQTLGIYQCYCSEQISKTSFFQIWTDPALEICGQYAAMGMGGSLLTIPSGVINAVAANLGVLLVTALIKKIRFKSRHTRMHVTVISLFSIIYINMGLSQLLVSDYQNYLPFEFTPYWLCFWGKAISVSLLTFNFMPYVGPVLKILYRRGICCCKRKDYKHNTFDNPPFNIERKYVQLLNTAFISSTYGFCLPILPTISFVTILGESILDTLLIAYYFKPQVLRSDLMNRTVIFILQFTVVAFLFFAAFAQFENYCSLENSTKTLVNLQEFRSCTGFSTTTFVLISAAAAILVAITIKTYFIKINQKDLIDSKYNYFERLSILDRKRWVVEEHYRRSQLGIQTISDETYEQLCSSQCRNFNPQNDPCNYNILSNKEYAQKFRYSGVVLAQSEEERQRHEQITMAVFDAFRVHSASIQ